METYNIPYQIGKVIASDNYKLILSTTQIKETSYIINGVCKTHIMYNLLYENNLTGADYENDSISINTEITISNANIYGLDSSVQLKISLEQEFTQPSQYQDHAFSGNLITTISIGKYEFTTQTYVNLELQHNSDYELERDNTSSNNYTIGLVETTQILSANYYQGIIETEKENAYGEGYETAKVVYQTTGNSVGDAFDLIGKSFATTTQFLGKQIAPGLSIGTIVCVPLVLTIAIGLLKLLNK